MKKIFIFIILFSFLSCSTRQKETYNVINSFFTENNHLNLKNDETYLVINQTYPLKNIEYYSFNWKTEKLPNIYLSEFRIFWADTNKKIQLEQKTISFLRSQINNEKKIFEWKQNKIKPKNVVIAKSDSIYNTSSKFNEFKLKKSISVFNFTKPIFSKDYKICVFGFYFGNNYAKYTSNYQRGLMIMKKENKKWIYLGYMKDNESD